MTDRPDRSADIAEALRLLAAEDARQDKLQEILETIREQIRLEVAPEHRPEGLFKNIQDAVYAMRGRTRLTDDAAITHVLSDAQRPVVLSSEQVMDVVRKVTAGDLRKMLTCKRWKDGIDIDEPTFAAERLAEEFIALAALASQPSPAATVETRDLKVSGEVIAELMDECEALRAQLRLSAATEGETKTVYVKRWRTLVKLPAKYADEIVAALRTPTEPQTAPDYRQALENAREEIVIAIAFLGRDIATKRLDTTATQLCARLVNADAAIRTALAFTHPEGK